MNSIKTDHLGEIPLFSSLRVFTDFAKKYNMGLEKYIQQNPTDFEAYSFAIHIAYKSALKVNGIEEVQYSVDDFLDRMSIQEFSIALPLIMGASPEKEEGKSDKKK